MLVMTELFLWILMTETYLHYKQVCLPEVKIISYKQCLTVGFSGFSACTRSKTSRLSGDGLSNDVSSVNRHLGGIWVTGKVRQISINGLASTDFTENWELVPKLYQVCHNMGLHWKSSKSPTGVEPMTIHRPDYRRLEATQKAVPALTK